MLTWYDLLDIELRNKDNPDVKTLLDEIYRLYPKEGVSPKDIPYRKWKNDRSSY